MSIPTFIINLKHRVDRKEHSTKEFSGRSEFDVVFVEAHENSVGDLGLWNTIKDIICSRASTEERYILICEDDHAFTESYTAELLKSSIAEAEFRGADLLVGGGSSVNSLFRVSDSLLWVEGYTGNQFIVVFRPFFQKILDAEFNSREATDQKLSSLSSDIYMAYPFLSIQKEFGYSDVTSLNNKLGRVEELFNHTSSAITYILEGAAFYGYNASDQYNDMSDYSENSISTYVINLANRPERLMHIKEQFKGRHEFEVTYVEACMNEIGALGLWHSIRKVIQMGIDNGDDVLILCEDDHVFTEYYSAEVLFRNIVEAHAQGADVLSAGTGGGFAHALPVASGRFWVNHFLSTQFLVVYRKFFLKMLDASFDDSVTADNLISGLTSNKMVIFPFISEQEDFGYSDVTSVHNEMEGLVTRMFKRASSRFLKISEAHTRNSQKRSSP